MKKGFFLSVIAMWMLSMVLVSCKDDDNDPSPTAYDDSDQVYATQGDENSCGAYSMAYYLAKTKQIEIGEIADKAKEFYSIVQFDKNVGFDSYSDPVKIKNEIAKYASKAELKMVKNQSTDGEKLLGMLAEYLQITDVTPIDNIEGALATNQFVIEIVVPHSQVDLENPTKNTLHYVLTFWKNGKLYTRDPGRGTEVLRSDFIDGTLKNWNFCEGGIFVTPK